MKRLLLIALMLFTVANATATTILQKNFDEVLNGADGVVIGTVARRHSEHGPDGDIDTFVTLSDLEILKGRYGDSTLTLRMLGGTVGHETLTTIQSAPSFVTEDRVVLFVKGNGRLMVPLVGWTQGMYRIRVGASGFEEVLDHDGNRVFGIDGTAIIKESRYSPEAHFVEPDFGRAMSTPPATVAAQDANAMLADAADAPSPAARPAPDESTPSIRSRAAA